MRAAWHEKNGSAAEVFAVSEIETPWPGTARCACGLRPPPLIYLE
jgi:hypothetical protein